MTGSLCLFIGFSQKVHRSDEQRRGQSQALVDAFDVDKFVYVCEVRTIPCQQDVASVGRGKGEMKCIERGLLRHDKFARVTSQQRQ